MKGFKGEYQIDSTKGKGRNIMVKEGASKWDGGERRRAKAAEGERR